MSSPTLGGWRIALRLARREALRRKAQTALMLVLICLPVLAVTAAAIVWRTADVTTVEGLDRRLGSADALVEATGFPRITQSVDPSEGFGITDDYDASNPASAQDVLDVLGTHGPIVEITRESMSFRTDRGVADMETFTSDLTSPLTEGLFELVEGRYPPGPGEVVVNQALADRGPAIGDTLTVIRKDVAGERTLELRIVGIAEATDYRGYPRATGLPGTFGTGATADGDQPPRWLVGGGPVNWSDVTALNAIGVLVDSRQVATDPPSPAELGPDSQPMSEPVDQLTITVLALIVAMVLLEVVLLAGPAFAVRAKAQAHTLALVAAAGGSPRQGRRTVLASGVVIGTAGGLVGAGLGIAVGAVAVPIAQRYDSSQFGPFEVPWLLVALVAAFGFVAAVLAAVVPAFSASRQNVVAVLAGRRGEGRPSGRTPIAGLVLLGGGVLGAAVGSRADGSGAVLIAGSAVVSTVGMIMVVPIVVAWVARSAARFPLALRFAARDAARHRTRTVPAVAAVAATVAGVVALGIAIGSQESANEARYEAQLPMGNASVTLWRDTDRVAVEATVERVLGDQRIDAIEGIPTDTNEGYLELRFRVAGKRVRSSNWSALGTPYLVGTTVPDVIALPAEDRQRADAVLAEGGVVLLRAAVDPVPEPAAEASVAVRLEGPDGRDGARGKNVSRSAPAAMLSTGEQFAPVEAVLSPALVEQLDLRSETVSLLMPGPIDTESAKDLDEALGALPDAPYLYVERGYQPDPAVRIMQFVLAALGGVLMLGGTLTATFLALSDARPDLATMAAIGARPRTRRRVAAAYALVVGGVGALLGTPVGFIPGLAISQPLTRSDAGVTAIDVPWLLIGAVVVGLPLLTAAAVGACARARLPLVARID